MLNVATEFEFVQLSLGKVRLATVFNKKAQRRLGFLVGIT
jgi:hypothetical protein